MSQSNFDDSARTPLDMDRLNESFMQNRDIVKTILSAFKDSFGDFESQFRDAEKQGDYETMSRLAHSLKGSAGNIRASQVAGQAAELQHQIDDQADYAEITGSFDDLLDSLDELNSYIDEFLS